MSRAPQVTVIGAGAVGICCALWLRRAGAEVTLIDRDPPGAGCSSGNAGLLGTGSCVPSALPGVIRRVPALLRAPEAPLGLPLRHLPRLAPWLLRFVLAARTPRVEAIADALHSLQQALLPAWRTLVDEAGAGELISRSGKLHTYESEAAFAAGRYGLELQRRRGVAFEILDADAVRQLVPGINPAVSRGVFYPDVAHSLHPQRMLEALARHFVARGGTLVRDEVQAIEVGADGPRRLIMAAGSRAVETLVVAAGVWSGPLAAKLGSRIPLVSLRGYHVMLPTPGLELRLPLKSEDRQIVATPMAHGLRLTGIAEFGMPADPPTPRRAEAVERAAAKLFPDLCRNRGVVWMGNRPCTPDSLPVIGRAPHHPRSVFAFGHGHLGLGLAAITGRLVSELILESRPSIALEPFRADRF